MKTLMKHISVLLMVSLFAISTHASAVTTPTLHDPYTTMRFVPEVDVACFIIPYSIEQLTRNWDTIMGLDIERIARENLSTFILGKEIVAVKYFGHDDLSISSACFYYINSITFDY